MQQNPLDYLLRLAALSVAFFGFATIVVTVRRALGVTLSRFHVLLVRTYALTGLIVAGASLLPSLFTLFGMESSLTWRVSSAILGITAPGFLIAYIVSRRSVEPGRIPVRVYVRYVISAIAVVGLWLNVAGVPQEPGGAIYAATLTWFLFYGGLAFIDTLGEAFHEG